MERTPKICSIFCLTKRDASDFDRKAVTQYLKIIPTETCGPIVSPGRLVSQDETITDLSGLTLIGSDGEFVKHAFWSIDMPKINSWSIEEPLQKLEDVLKGRESFVRTACEQYSLVANLILRIFADSNNMPEITLSAKSISFWASMGVNIDFDFCLN